MKLAPAALALALFVAPLAAGCQSAYYEAMEVFGKEKRDLLRSELNGMVTDQKEAEHAFTDALTRVKALTHFDGGDLEREYEKLKDASGDAQSSVADIDSRMNEIETVGSDLFAEWEEEIAQIQSPNMRDASRQKLRETRARFDTMRGQLRETRRSMDPVLALLNDHVLFLKHNLNAAAIGSLGEAMGDIEDGIEDLKGRIQESIREAQRFLAAMQ